MRGKLNIFISYSHKDEKWKEELELFLKPKIRDDSLIVWNDRDIKVGERWDDEIKKAIVSSDIAIILVTKHFLASDFIQNREIPFIQKNNLKIYPLIISHCDWTNFDYIKIHQGGLKDNKILAGRREHEIDEALTDFVERLCKVKNDKVIADIENSLPKAPPNIEPSKTDQIFLIFNENDDTKYKVIGYVQCEDEFDNELIEFTFDNIYDEDEQEKFIYEIISKAQLDNVPIHVILPPTLFLINLKQWRYKGNEFKKLYHILLHNKERFDKKIGRYKNMITNWNNLFGVLKDCNISDALLFTKKDSDRFDTGDNKIGVCFKQSVSDYKVIEETLIMAYIGLWQYQDGIVSDYHKWIESEICLESLNTDSRKYDHVALLWDDMSLLEKLKRK